MKHAFIITATIILIPAALLHTVFTLSFKAVMSFLFFPFKVLSDITAGMIKSERERVAKQVE